MHFWQSNFPSVHRAGILGVCVGEFEQKKGEIDANLGRSKKDRKKIAVTKEGKHAVTEYKVIASLDFLSLVRLHLKTGRTHQIRVHLAHMVIRYFGIRRTAVEAAHGEDWMVLKRSERQIC